MNVTAINPFFKYTPKIDRLYEQIHNKFKCFNGFDKARNANFHQSVDWPGETHNGWGF